MKLIFKILWFEDDNELVGSGVGPEIKSFLEKEGFIYELIYRENGDELEELLKDKSYDLIMTDLNLGEEHETGKRLIEQMRSENVLTEVLLYSGNQTALQDIMDEKGIIERISFCEGIENLSEKAQKIIHLIIRKVQDVNNMRGLVIAETIILEKKIETVLLDFFAIAEGVELDDKRNKLLEKAYERVIDSHTKNLTSVQSIPYNEIKKLIDEDILTAGNCFDSLNGILNMKIGELNVELNSGKIEGKRKEELKKKLDELGERKKDLSDFRTEILNVRNTMAHVEEKKQEDGTPYLESKNKKGGVIKFTEESCAEIRNKLKKHSGNLDLILQHIK